MPYNPLNLPLAQASVLTVQGTAEKIADGYLFILVLNGEIEIAEPGTRHFLNRLDILMLPVGTRYQLSAWGSNLILMLSLRSDFFVQGLSERLGGFVCDSATDTSRDYAPVRKLITQIAMVYFEKSDINGLRLHELCYSLVFYLNRYHYVPSTDRLDNGEDKQPERLTEIVHFIEQNYMQPLTLQDIAERMHLSSSYLSKYIKQSLGKNFYTYLSAIRLEHAVADLLNTEQPITNIAFNNGFSNINSFIKLFKDTYGMTPSKYRRQTRELKPIKQEGGDGAVIFMDYNALEGAISELPEGDYHAAEPLVSYPHEKRYAVSNVNRYQEVIPLWQTMINIGFGKSVTDSGLQSQLALAQREIGFKYCRIQGVLSAEILPMKPGEEEFNFSEFDRFIEYILSIGLTPFFDLTNRSHHLFLNPNDYVYTTQAKREPVNEESYLKDVSALMRHCINTFGDAEVESWGFEIGYYHDELLNPTESPGGFVRRFKRTFDLIKSLAPHARVGGICHNTSISPQVLESILCAMDDAALMADFISIILYSYEAGTGKNTENAFVISSDQDTAVKRVDKVRAILEGHKRQTQKIYATVFGADVNARNYVNDTVYQSSFFVKNTIDLLGKVDVLGYWQLSDIEASYADASRILFGGTGILSKDGIKKPGFTAIKRLSHISPYLVEKGNGYMVATNTRNTYYLVVYNYAHFNEMYCLRSGSKIALDEAYSVFDSPETQDVAVTLSGLAAGSYKVVSITLGREHGSLLDEWVKYGMLDNLQPVELQYFRDIVHPQRLARYISCPDGQLSLHVQLLPHEVKFFTIMREL